MKNEKLNDHIPTSEIEQDIIDTEREINQYESELTVLAKDTQGNRLDIYMREGNISHRKQFISELNSILEDRKTLICTHKSK